MTHYALVDASLHKIIGVITTDFEYNATEMANAKGALCFVVNNDVARNPKDYVYDGTTLLRIPDAPDKDSVFDYALRQWVTPAGLTTLEEAKAAKWQEIKYAKDVVEYGGFTWNGMTFDSDLTSQSKIANAAASGESVSWTLKDNSQVDLTNTQLKELLAALIVRANELQQQASSRRNEINEATTLDAVAAIHFTQEN